MDIEAVDPVDGPPLRLEGLDDYLRRRESCVPNLRKDCEKRIVWYRDRIERTPRSVVYLHGFSASRMETWPLCDRLVERLGANLFYTRLTGHGQDGPAMGAARIEDWLADGIEAMAIGSRIGERVILVGTSTGGTLATWLASRPALAGQVHTLVLLSPNFSPKNPLAAAALWPPALKIFGKCFGSWRTFTVTQAELARYWTTRYPLNALATMMQMVRRAWRVDLRQARMPVLMMINPWDRVINVSLAALRFRGFPSPDKRLVLFRRNRDPGRHVLAGHLLSPRTTEAVLAVILDFLTGIDGH